MLPFRTNGHLTLGVEIELQLIDRQTLDLKPVALDVLKDIGESTKIKPEIFQSMLEINTGICTNVHEVKNDLHQSMELLNNVCTKHGVLISSTGTHPFAKYSERIIYPADRYQYLIDRNQWIARRLMIFGMHVHIGMKDGDSCIRFNNFMLYFVPHIIALTASSPFWQGEETGLASSRSTIFESCPTAGHPCRVTDWQGFSELVAQMTECKAINSLKDIWWDIRPSPDFGTLEIRACDGPATLQETTAVVAFIHSLARWYDANADYDQVHPAPQMWIMRENKWRATRHGLEALLIKDQGQNLISLREDMATWMDRIWPFAEKLGYQNYWQNLKTIMEQGNSTQRQLKIFDQSSSTQAVTQHNTEEFSAGVPNYIG